MWAGQIPRIDPLNSRKAYQDSLSLAFEPFNVEAKQTDIPEAVQNEDGAEGPAGDLLVSPHQVLAADAAGRQAQEEGVAALHQHRQQLEH